MKLRVTLVGGPDDGRVIDLDSFVPELHMPQPSEPLAEGGREGDYLDVLEPGLPHIHHYTVHQGRAYLRECDVCGAKLETT